MQMAGRVILSRVCRKVKAVHELINTHIYSTSSILLSLHYFQGNRKQPIHHVFVWHHFSCSVHAQGHSSRCNSDGSQINTWLAVLGQRKGVLTHCGINAHPTKALCWKHGGGRVLHINTGISNAIFQAQIDQLSN